jgi:hypothetical protein
MSMEKALTIVVQVILRIDVTKLSYKMSVMLWSWSHVILIKGNKQVGIEYIIK